MKLLTLAGLAMLVSVCPVAASQYACLVGDPNETIDKLMANSGQQPLLKFEIETGAQPLPAMLIGKPDGSFSIMVLMKGMTCVMAIGHGMAPAENGGRLVPGQPS